MSLLDKLLDTLLEDFSMIKILWRFPEVLCHWFVLALEYLARVENISLCGRHRKNISFSVRWIAVW